jgi:hypothetical protein
VNETYTTASGLALYFEKDSVYPPSEKKYVSALGVAPGGVCFDDQKHPATRDGQSLGRRTRTRQIKLQHS